MELRKRGVCLNHKTALKRMNEMDLRCKIGRKKYNSFRKEINKTAKNIIKRDFHAKEPNQKWTTDVTDVACQL